MRKELFILCQGLWLWRIIITSDSSWTMTDVLLIACENKLYQIIISLSLLIFFMLVVSTKNTTVSRSGNELTHSTQWAWSSGSWRSMCPCWRPHRWAWAHPPPWRPGGSCWTWLSSHHCLPTDTKHTWQSGRGDGQPLSRSGGEKNNPHWFVLANKDG